MKFPIWPNNLKVGFHLSIGAGPRKLFERFTSRGCSALQIFVASPRVWNRKSWSKEMISEFMRERECAGNPPLAVHTGYLINLASDSPIVRERSVQALQFEYSIATQFEADFLVLHMGSCSENKTGIMFMLENIEKALSKIASDKPLLLLENTAGERHDLGSNLEEVAEFRQRLSIPSGLCFDTCHAFQAGYDFRTRNGLRKITKTLKDKFGDALKLIHLNDSKNPFGARHDRHEDIGLGTIGAEALARFLLSDICKGLSVILETPQAGADDPTADLGNLERLKNAFEKLRLAT